MEAGDLASWVDRYVEAWKTRCVRKPRARRDVGFACNMRAIGEERGAAFGQIQAPLVEFREVGDEDRRHLPLAPRQVLHPGKEVIVGELSHGRQRGCVHGSVIA